MTTDAVRSFATPRDGELGLATIANGGGLSIACLPNGSLFQIEHRDARGAILINQVLGSPIHGGIGRIYLRVGGAEPFVTEIVGAEAKVRFGAGSTGFAWEGETAGIRHRVTLSLAAGETAWFWRVEITNDRRQAVPFDLVSLQDVGLGGRGFLMGSEAYASQYLDHQPVVHPGFGPVVMTRQNLSQGGRYPWLVQGCLDGAAAFATDALQVFGPAYRSGGVLDLPFGEALPGTRLQHEVACPMIQSAARELEPGAAATVTFFSLYVADHPDASGEADLARLDAISTIAAAIADEPVQAIATVRGVLQDAPLLRAEPLDAATLDRLHPDRLREETRDGRLLSFFVADGAQNRHVVLPAKEDLVPRRHGAILRSGQGMLIDDETLSATCWMQGIFAAQLTIGNTSFHKLFSVSRDPYGLTRASGLRILVDTGAGWRLLAVPSLFEIGLSDCRWIYRLADRTITVRGIAAGDAAAMQWTVDVEGPACRFLVLGHVVLGEREYEQSGTIAIDPAAKRISMRPGDDWLWGQRYPEASLHLVTSTPGAIEAIGGDELLYSDGVARNGSYVAMRSEPTNRLVFAVVGSMTDAAESARLADRYAAGLDDEDLLAPARRYWSHVTRDLKLAGDGSDIEAHNLLMPWLAHDAMVHLTVPHGLEQYSGAAWGTRDVCQGPVEFLLALRHDATVRSILLLLFAEQDRAKGDWPQWFMLAPYANIRAGESHGDIVVWPLKALCDYIEATDDLPFLNEKVAWRDNGQAAGSDTIGAHVETLLATVRSRFIPGTHLIRYGEGDWNDSLQPHDPHLRDWMVSSWTVSLLYEQVVRYAAILARVGRSQEAAELGELASAMQGDFNRHLIRDGVVAGYGLFDPVHDQVELLLHPTDTRTGLHYSLIAMTQPILGGLFTPEQSRDHLDRIAENLAFPDGVRLMDRPVAYAGGPETLFRRAESASYFGREIGLMYVHAHLRYCETLAIEGDAEALWQAIALVNPITVGERLAQASPRQSNSYFSSSDAAFPDRYAASADWDKVHDGSIAVDGGWRIYSSGPGLFTRLVLSLGFGLRRKFGNEGLTPLIAPSFGKVSIELDIDGRRVRHDVEGG